MILIRTAKNVKGRRNCIDTICDGAADGILSRGELHTDRAVGFTSESGDVYFGVRGLSALGGRKLILMTDSGKGEFLGIELESASALISGISETTELPFIEHGEYRFDHEDWAHVLENASLISDGEDGGRINDIMKWSELVLDSDGMMKVYA